MKSPLIPTFAINTGQLNIKESKMKYSMFIGRWQPWHDGHRWLINQRLYKGKNVLICINQVSLMIKILIILKR